LNYRYLAVIREYLGVNGGGDSLLLPRRPAADLLMRSGRGCYFALTPDKRLNLQSIPSRRRSERLSENEDGGKLVEILSTITDHRRMCYLFGAHFHTASAIGNPTSTVWPIGPVITDAGSNLGGHRCTAESGRTTSVITSQTNSPYNNPAITGCSVRNAICLLAT
jgi:hypothetical protein